MSKSAELVFLPLGGAGEIGMNMYLYGVGPERDRHWIMVDCGVTFGDMETTPGVDLIMADPEFIAAQSDRLHGLFLTHAHEDHVGALGRLWPELECPIYARRFTGRIAEGKMAEAGLDTSAIQVCPAMPEMIQAGPFRVGFMPISHSIPEASALVIEAGGHRILHSGDFKVDRDPQVGEPFDPAAFEALGRQGVDALVCDSTNVFSPNPGRSEAEIVEPIAELVKGAKGLVIATTFASNIARLRTLARAAKGAGRSVALQGRAMQRMLTAARETGVLKDFPDILSEERMLDTPAEHLMVLASGSQGERRAAVAQIANGSSPRVRAEPGDMVLFSSKTIPGNEKSVARIVNRFSEQGAQVVDDSGGLYHVSGHANRPDLQQLHRLVQPKLLVPMHGEHRHLVEHAGLARESGIPSLVVTNGAIARLAGGPAEIVGSADTGRLYLDGSLLIGAFDGVVRDRLKLALRGLIVAGVVVDQEGDLAADPVVRIQGVANDLDEEIRDLAGAMEDAIDAAFDRANAKQLRSDEAIETLVSSTCSQLCRRLTGRKPVVTVLVSRVETD
ncbi:ribonuclease J [Oceanicella sp. SM1341]|uniref:ribonuclease J n=1 Tax=Oceanicella sp. SM1341 TaxID=1548889 RepID=UPI000E4C98D5|nr:ribonuclease J [Oceanicella sp. SM1341]